MTTLYQWASLPANHPPREMATVEELEAQGFERCRPHPFYPVVLMRKVADDERD